MQRDLNNTLIFAKVVELGGFAAASRTLGLPTSTVSRKLRELEERLGARLLNRTTRRLALTEAGSVYYEYSKRIATDLDQAENAVHQLEGSPRGWLRVTAPYSLGTGVLAPILVDFRERYPEVRLDIILSNDRLDLVADEIDVALRIGNLPDSTLVARRLALYPTRIYAGEGYLARYGEPLIPEDLQHHHALATTANRRSQRYCWMLDNGERSAEFEIQPVLVVNDPALALSLLAGNQGLMLASEVMVDCYTQTIGVRRVLASWRGPEVALNAVFVGGRVLSPKVRVFVDFVAERMQQWCTNNCAVDVRDEKERHPQAVAVSA